MRKSLKAKQRVFLPLQGKEPCKPAGPFESAVW